VIVPPLAERIDPDDGSGRSPRQPQVSIHDT